MENWLRYVVRHFSRCISYCAIKLFHCSCSNWIFKYFRKFVFKHVIKFTLNEFDEVGTASLITRTTNDVNQIQRATIMILRMALMAPFMLVGGLIMALSKDAKLSMTILIVIPFLVGI